MLCLIGDIYAAATSPDRWPKVLEAISDQLGGAAVMIGRADAGATWENAMGCRLPPGAVEAFARAFGTVRPAAFLETLATLPFATPITPEASEGEASFLVSPAYTMVLRPYGLRYLACAVLHREPGWMTYITVARPHSSRPFAHDELERFGWLAQHLGRAVVLQHALAAACATGVLLADVIDHFDRGAIVVDARGHVRLVNRVARRVLDRDDGLVIAAGRLRASIPIEVKRLHCLIAECAATSAGTGLAAGGPVGISRRDGGRPYALVVSPLSSTMLAGVKDPALALVLITDPECPLPTAAHLVACHAFTPAEARLAIRLLLDETAIEAAQALGVRVTTIRFHLRNMLAKTGVRRQSEMLPLLRAN